MKPPRPATQFTLPIRLTLVDQAAEYLRQGIMSGKWRTSMPSEGELCRELGVSRGTLRSAMSQLFREGLLQSGGRGGRHMIARTPELDETKFQLVRGNTVRLLSPQPRFIIAGHTQMILQTVSEALGRAGLHLEFEYHKGLWELQRPQSKLRKIVDQPDTAGWFLYRSTQAVQEWFSRSGIPTVAMGSTFPGIPLPSVAFDLVAATRHAAGVFASRGHRHMAFLTIENATAGDLACAEAFRTAAASLRCHAQVAAFDDTVAGLCRAIDGLLLGNPAPSAYFVACANHVPATIGHLTRRGYPVPQSAVVISRMDAHLLAESIPTVARYQMDAERFGRGMARLMLRALNPVAKQRSGKFVVMPEFVDAESAGLRLPLQ
jgi:DNA-binding LacI/PurR family transcriptional regulator